MFKKTLLRILPGLKQREGGFIFTMQRAMAVYRQEGFSGVRARLRSIVSRSAFIRLEDSQWVSRNDYSEWVRRYDTLDDAARARIRDSVAAMQRLPRISVIMPVYDPPLEFLDQAIWSVRNQLYSEWELCIADDASKNQVVRDMLTRHAAEDARIRIVFHTENGHISRASNSALELATGEFVALLDNDDLLSEHALFCVAKAILATPDAGMIYSDEDKIDQALRRHNPYFKPDWNPDLFLSHNMISHLGVYRTDLAKRLRGFREGYEGSQDYDLALRCTEQLAPQQIVHIPRVLYHWRAHPKSTASSADAKPYAMLAGEHAINDHLERMGIAGRVKLAGHGYRAHYPLPEKPPLVSLIIPTRNGLQLIRHCIDSINKKTTYPSYEIIVVDNGSDDPATLDYFASLAGMDNIQVLRDDRPFNYSALNNLGVARAKGEIIGLLNNDIEVISPDWLSEMVSHACRPEVGAVGAKLLYPNDTLQHAGIICGIGGWAGHSHKGRARNSLGYAGRTSLISSFSAVTGACLIIKKSIYQQLGGLNEQDLKIAYNDVDFCLRAREAGYRNIWTPYAELYHHESATRGHEDTPEKKLRFQNEVLYMKKRWGGILLNDPAYNPNLTLDREDFSLAWPPRVEPIAG